MTRPVDALISRHGTTGDTVNHADLATQLEALHPQCFRWAMTCCGNRREDAEDVLHDTYVGVLDNGIRFSGGSTFRTWLFGVIRNKARARQRRERLRALLGVRHASRIDPPAAAVAPDDGAVASERRKHTHRALARLPRRQREVLLLVFYHDLTVEEAADVMRVSVGTARAHYARAKQRMARLLEDERA